jgi:hypothetical protein
VAESFFALGEADRREVLELARERTGRPAHLLEKDAWVVWSLNALYSSGIAPALTFKGGTSLSKAYKLIDRFSDDLDLTYDIRRLIPDLTEDGVPQTRSQADKRSAAVHDRLAKWIAVEVRPILEKALAQDGLTVTFAVGGDRKEKLLLHYVPLATGTGYVPPAVTLEFGGRATGEPHQVMPVACDMAGFIDDVTFPTASPQVLSVSRTFWEKATAAHVYCAQNRLRGARFARHWHDLAAIQRSACFSFAIADRGVAKAVAEHKSLFFIEKDPTGSVIDYFKAVDGNLKIVPEGAAREVLAADYELMRADDVMIGNSSAFDELMEACAGVEKAANSSG